MGKEPPPGTTFGTNTKSPRSATTRAQSSRPISRNKWKDLIDVLRQFRLRKTDPCEKRREQNPQSPEPSTASSSIRDGSEKSFEIRVTADGNETLAPTHHVDYYRNRIAVEIEWNNKDPFFDRDLTTFRLLFELNVLSVGIIITRADELQELFIELGKLTAAGQSTTHMSKLIPKMYNRASGGCPVLALGITKKKYDAHA